MGVAWVLIPHVLGENWGNPADPDGGSSLRTLVVCGPGGWLRQDHEATAAPTSDKIIGIADR
jgi:hypothetical protein